jgi:hypothetical protein
MKMAVQGTEPPRSSTGPGGKGEHADGKGGKAWLKKNKLLAGAMGIGGVLLLAAHKGKGGGIEGEAAALANRQAEENERAAAEAGSIIPAATPPARAGAGEGSEGVGSGGIASSPAEAVEKAASEVSSAVEKNTAAIETEGGKDAVNQESGTTTKASAKPKAKKPVRKSTTKKSGHSGVTVHGRHFPGAKGHKTTKVRKDSKGNVHHSITVDHGGHSSTHTSHNNGKSWTDHPAGHGPPKRTTKAKSHVTLPPLHKGAPLPGGGSGGYVVRPRAKPKPAPKKYKRVRA